MNEQDAEQLLRVANGLMRRTRGKNIEWTPVSGTRADRYEYSGLQSSVYLQSRDKDGLPPYELLILNDQGRQVERFSTMEGEAQEVAEGGNIDQLVGVINDLYPLVVRNAIKYDEIIGGLLDELETDG